MSKILRPHHGMCFQFYEGKGYSEDFTDHMGRIIHEMEENPAQQITLKVETDIVCKNCPNNESGVCVSQDKVRKYDNAVLQACEIKEGSEMTYNDFVSTVKAKIIDTPLREEICGDCGWNYICENFNKVKK